jgi:hypothetical protein
MPSAGGSGTRRLQALNSPLVGERDESAGRRHRRLQHGRRGSRSLLRERLLGDRAIPRICRSISATTYCSPTTRQRKLERQGSGADVRVATIRSSTTGSSRGRRRPRRNTAAPTSSRPAIPSSGSDSPRARTPSSREHCRMASRWPTATTTRRTRCSSRGSCGCRRTGSPSRRRVPRRTSGATRSWAT